MSYNWNWSVFFSPTPSGNTTYLMWLLEGLKWTVVLSLSAWVIAIILGSVIGVLRTVPNRILSSFAASYVELFRNIAGSTLHLVFRDPGIAADFDGERVQTEQSDDAAIHRRIGVLACSPARALPNRCAPASTHCPRGNAMPASHWASRLAKPTAM